MNNSQALDNNSFQQQQQQLSSVVGFKSTPSTIPPSTLFSPHADDIIIKSVHDPRYRSSTSGKILWVKIAKQELNEEFSGKQIRSRYLRMLHPNRIHGTNGLFTPQEDAIILEMTPKLNYSWCALSRECFGCSRTDEQVRQRFFALMMSHNPSLTRQQVQHMIESARASDYKQLNVQATIILPPRQTQQLQQQQQNQAPFHMLPDYHAPITPIAVVAEPAPTPLPFAFSPEPPMMMAQDTMPFLQVKQEVQVQEQQQMQFHPQQIRQQVITQQQMTIPPQLPIVASVPVPSLPSFKVLMHSLFPTK